MNTSHSILFVVLKPVSTDYKLEKNWHDCVSILSDLTNKKTDVELLAENCLLIPLHDTLETLVKAVQAVKGFRYKYAILTEELEWHEVANKI